MNSDPSLVSNPFATLTLIVAPAVLTNAASVLAMSTSNRFLRASERMRQLASKLDSTGEPEASRRLWFTHAGRVESQAVLLLRALASAYVALGSFAFASLISIIGGALTQLGYQRASIFSVAIALLAGFTGAGGLVIGCIALFRATRLSMQNVIEEGALLRERHHTLLDSPVGTDKS